jgi:hypothetical protein
LILLPSSSSSYVKPYITPKLILGYPPSVTFNCLSVAAAVICSFFLRIQGAIVIIVCTLWVLCYGKAAAVQGNVQLLHDAIAPLAGKVR